MRSVRCQAFCRIFGTLHIEAKAAKITVSLHSACVVRHFTGQYSALCRITQRCGQLLDSRRENIVSKFLCLRKKALLPRFLAHIVIGVPDFRCKLAIFVRLCICQLCCTRILTVFQQRGDTVSCIFISQYNSTRACGYRDRVQYADRCCQTKGNGQCYGRARLRRLCGIHAAGMQQRPPC